MSDQIKITGTVHTCLPLETFPSGFQKRVLVLVNGGEWPQHIPIEFHKDKADLLTGLRKGQEVTACVNIRGNEYNGKYYPCIQGWKLDKGDGFEKPESAAPSAPAKKDDSWIDGGDDQTIPF